MWGHQTKTSPVSSFQKVLREWQSPLKTSQIWGDGWGGWRWRASLYPWVVHYVECISKMTGRLGLRKLSTPSSMPTPQCRVQESQKSPICKACVLVVSFAKICPIRVATNREMPAAGHEALHRVVQGSLFSIIHQI